jgi:hypothetical protein
MAPEGATHLLALSCLVAAIALAGCAGLVGRDSPSVVERTVTPAPVPTDGDPLPPGVTESGVSVVGLTETHAVRLRATNYTYVSRQRVVEDDTVLRRTNRTRRVATGGQQYAGRFDRTVLGFPVATIPGTMDYWTNGSVYATQRFIDGEPEFYGWSRTGQPTEDIDGSAFLARVLRAVETSVVDRESGVMLAGSELRDPDALPNPPYMTTPQNVSLTASVTADGVVTRWRLAYDTTVENQSVRVVRITRISDVGRTVVDRPPWIDTAREWQRERFLHDD